MSFTDRLFRRGPRIDLDYLGGSRLVDLPALAALDLKHDSFDVVIVRSETLAQQSAREEEEES